MRKSNLVTWRPPAGTHANETWQVAVRELGTKDWTELFVGTVKIGHQGAIGVVDPLLVKAGIPFRGPVDTSLVTLDFDGAVEFRVTFMKGTLTTSHLSPLSYKIPVRKDGNTLCFTVRQNASAPRKLVLRANDNWEEDCLHILSNPTEKDAPRETDPAVLVIEPGQEIPRTLPKGKSVYYFKPGNHQLPRGLWIDFDLGAVTRIDRFDLLSGPLKPWQVPGGQNYRIEYRQNPSEPWRTACENLANFETDLREVSFTPVSARYVRLVLLGNSNNDRKDASFRWPHSNYITAFRLYEAGSKRVVSNGKAIDGPLECFAVVAQENNTTPYGYIRASEVFFLTQDGVTLYLAPGAVVKGAIRSDGRRDLSIKGRGVLDASELMHEPGTQLNEARTSAIWCENTDKITIEGITVLDSPMWAVIVNGSKNATVRNINIFGSVFNSDGVHMSRVTNGLVQGCFIRTTDDLFVMYHYGPAKGVTVKHCVFWSDGARIFLIGLATTPGDIIGVTIDNCDILNVHNVWDMSFAGGMLHLVATGGNAISDLKLTNIRIERFRAPEIASLLHIETGNRDYPPGRIRNLMFSNIQYSGENEYISTIQGTDAEHDVRGVAFRNVVWGKQRLSAANLVNLKIGPFVSGVTVDGIAYQPSEKSGE